MEADDTKPLHAPDDIAIDSVPTRPLHQTSIRSSIDLANAGTAAGAAEHAVAAVTAAATAAMSSTVLPAAKTATAAIEQEEGEEGEKEAGVVEDKGTITSPPRPQTPTSNTAATTSASSSSTTGAASGSEDSNLSTPRQESTKPIFVTTTTFHDEPLDPSSLSTSPQPETPTGPRTPTTSNDEPGVDRDSSASVALSNTSLDHDHPSTEDVEPDETLATPRVTGARRHLRKVSSLDLLQNKVSANERPRTLFDTDDISMQLPSSAIDLRESDKEDIWRRDLCDMPNYVDDRRATNATLDSIDMLDPGLTPSTERSRCSSLDNRLSDISGEHVQVDWQALDKNEEQEKEDKELPAGTEDESTAFLLARLEQENAKFAADPKAAANRQARRSRAHSRPPSMAQLKRLVEKKDLPSLRHSIASPTRLPEEPPPMTELEFWVALVQDYASTAKRLPTLTTTKIRTGIPPPLRGVVWTSIAGARDKELEDAYDSLLGEKSSYEGIINKDVGRSFPGVELFRDADGEGQQMLGRVLKCFSLYDKDIGYCQGLGFLVGPLLMNMGERDSFCVLVRLMDHYSLRHSFLPSLSGLHMRIYQFSALLKQHHPKLHQHLADHGIEPAYLSQWFLSCFAVTCPLTMLFRIYDVIFAEGANETVMRVALALMRRHEEKMLATTEFEEIMQLLLGREIWDCYGGDGDVMVDDFTSLGDIVTYARLAELQKEFETQSSETVGQSAGFLPDVQAAAGRFLGRLWAPGPGNTPSKPAPVHAANPSTASITTLSPESADKAPTRGFFGGRPTSFLRRLPSRQDLGNGQDGSSSEDNASTTGSGVASLASTSITEPDTPTAHTDGTIRESVADSASMKSRQDSIFPSTSSIVASQQQDLHAQIEDLLVAIGEMQREQAQMAALLQKEREDRSEDQKIMRQLVNKMRKDKDDRRRTMPPLQKNVELRGPTHNRALSVGDQSLAKLDGTGKLSKKDELDDLIQMAQERLQTNVRFSTSLESKAQLRSTLVRTREQLVVAQSQSHDLAVRLEASEAAVVAAQDESDDMRSEIKELRQRVNDDFRARQKLEHQLSELKAQARSIERKGQLARAESLQEVTTLTRGPSDLSGRKSSVTSMSSGSVSSSGGLRELKLGRRASISSVQSLRRMSRNPSPVATDLAPPFIQNESVSPDRGTANCPIGVPPLEAPQAVPVTAAVDKLTSNHRRGFSQRTSSLATQEIFASETHEAVPEEALLMELVNAKTSEAQARQELDEVKKALSVAKRTQEETVLQMRAEIEAAKAQTQKAMDAASAAKSETEAVRQSTMGGVSSLFTLPPTPQVENIDPIGSRHTPTSSADEKSQSGIHVAKKTEDKPANPSAGVGWFWQRRTASRSTNATIEEAK